MKMTNENEKRKKHTIKKKQDFRREDNNNKRITKIRNIELRAISIGPKPFLCFFFFMFGVSLMFRTIGCFPLKKRVFLFIFECIPPFFYLLFSLPCLTVWLISSFRFVFEITICYLCFLPWPQPLFGVFFSCFFLLFLLLFSIFCFGFVFVAFAFLCLLKMSEKGRVTPYGPPSKNSVSEVLTFEHKFSNS